MILGIDISSSVTGVTFLDDNGKWIDSKYIDLRTTTKKSKEQFKDLFDKIDHCVERFKAWKELSEDEVKQIHIEEALSKFTPGRSSIHTLETLFKINHSLSYELYKIFNIKPTYWHPGTVRKINGLKIPKGADTKQEVFNFCIKHFPEFAAILPSDLPKSNPWIDAADSLLIARAGFLSYDGKHELIASNSPISVRKLRTKKR